MTSMAMGSAAISSKQHMQATGKEKRANIYM